MNRELLVVISSVVQRKTKPKGVYSACVLNFQKRKERLFKIKALKMAEKSFKNEKCGQGLWKEEKLKTREGIPASVCL